MASTTFKLTHKFIVKSLPLNHSNRETTYQQLLHPTMSDPITITIKAPSQEKVTVTIVPTETVAALKTSISSQLSDTPPESQRLIYSGKVLKDDQILSSYGIANGHTIHLVKSAGPKPATSSATAAPTSATTTTTAGSTAPRATTTTPTTPSAGGLGADPLAALLGGLGGAGGMGAMGNMGMGNMGMGGGMGNMGNMMGNPAMAQMMSSLMSNPEFMEQMIASNPMLQSMMTPEMRQMMRNPEVMRMMSNPAMLQMAMQMGGGGMGGGMGGFGGNMGAFGNPAAATSPTANPTTTPTTGASPAAAAGANPLANMPFMMNPGMLAAMGLGGAGAGMGAGANPNVRPEEMFQTQLRQLQDMGFYDASQNLRALQMCGGNVEMAVEWLFSQPR